MRGPPLSLQQNLKERDAYMSPPVRILSRAHVLQEKCQALLNTVFMLVHWTSLRLHLRW